MVGSEVLPDATALRYCLPRSYTEFEVLGLVMFRIKFESYSDVARRQCIRPGRVRIRDLTHFFLMLHVEFDARESQEDSMSKRGSLYLLYTLLLVLGLSTSAFAQAERKVAHAILIDNTGSLRSQFGEVLTLSKGIVERTHHLGPISLFNFTTSGDKKNPSAVITTGIEWTQNTVLLNDYMDRLFVVPGQTTLMDAIDSMVAQLQMKANLEKDGIGEKIIFLITDGEDRTSKIKEKQLIERLKKSGIKVYAFGLIEELESQRGIVNKSKRGKAENFLKKITSETGGRAVFPRSNSADINLLLNELLTK